MFCLKHADPICQPIEQTIDLLLQLLGEDCRCLMLPCKSACHCSLVSRGPGLARLLVVCLVLPKIDFGG